jgi:hypothetical protein
MTGSRVLVVEGPADKAFYRQWFLKRGRSSANDVIVEAIDAITVDLQLLDVMDLTHGARSYVFCFASEAASSGARIIGLADRDCGHRVGELTHLSQVLWFTEYPALESYAFDAQTFDTLNALFLGQRLPSGVELVAAMSPILRELYTVRLHNENLAAPIISNGFDATRSLTSFDVTRTIGVHLRAESSEYVRPSGNDPKAWAYGHDIAKLLYVLYANEIKTQSKISDVEVLEAALRTSLLVCGNFDDTVLGRTLDEWAA